MHGILKYCLALILCAWTLIPAFCQQVFEIKQDGAYSLHKLNIEKERAIVRIEGELTALRMYWQKGDEAIEMVSGDQNALLTGLKGSDNLHPTDFVVLDAASNLIELRTNGRGILILEGFDASYKPSPSKGLKYKQDHCQQPERFGPENWRDGLSDPSPGRTEVIVKHCIIHHAASSNAQTDYTSVVRSIYLLHTQSNGWDDIGYNYLIAPNGQIYLGRDPLGAADEDNIQGAHFCAKNSGTMGICLIGDYTQISPSDSMMLSLNNLLSWKLNKEELSAYDEFPHPNSNSPMLGSIAMHREGCSTVCPGDSVALRIPETRIAVQSLIDDCTSAGQIDKKLGSITIYPNPSQGLFILDGIQGFQEIQVYDSKGQLKYESAHTLAQLDLSSFAKGTYWICLSKADGSRLFRAITIQ